eukprot:5580673-Amphidinium_carterae.1
MQEQKISKVNAAPIPSVSRPVQRGQTQLTRGQCKQRSMAARNNCKSSTLPKKAWCCSGSGMRFRQSKRAASPWEPEH